MATGRTVAGAARERFQALLDGHRGIVLKVAATYCADLEERRDLGQEIATQLWRAFPRYDERRSFSTWMYRVALNVAISHLRRAVPRAQRTERLDEEALAALPASPAEEPDERLAMLRRAIDRLEALDRALLLLHLEERSYREIAEVLGISETNVATKLGRLRQRLREDFAGKARDGEERPWSSKT